MHDKYILSLYAFLGGYLLDLIVGDPSWLFHFVRFIGQMISSFDKIFNKFPLQKKRSNFFGFLTVFLTIIISCGIFIIISYFLAKISLFLFFGFEAFIIFQCLATKSLRVESMYVYKELKKSNLEKAREKVSRIVGRDTNVLDEKGICKATIETIAENTCDGIISPLFYISFLGALGGVFCKSVNTLDSMIGYKNEKYKFFGTFGARLDDVVQFIPARLAAYFMIFSSYILGFDGKNAYKVFRRDRYKHASINSAQTESVCAGALQIQLAGDAIYGGKIKKKEFIGDPIKNVEYEDIINANKLMKMTSVLFFIFSMLVRIILFKILGVF